MTPHEKDLINKLVANKLSEADFLNQFSVHFVNDSSYLGKTLTQAIENKDSDLVEYALILGFKFDLFHMSDVALFNQLLVSDWHNSHENLAVILKQLKSPSSVDFLYRASNLELLYLDYDENFELARKCIWALSSINNHKAKEKLELLAQSKNEIIADYAKDRLKHFNRT